MSAELKRTYVPFKDWKEKSKQTEYTENTPLLAPDGTLLAKGWARKNVFEYNRDYVKTGIMSRKEWDFYNIADDKMQMLVSFANINMGGYVAAKLVDLKTGKVIIDATQLFLGGKKHIPPAKGDEPNRFKDKIGGAEFDFITKETERTLRFKKKHGGKNVECTCQMDIMPGLENITTVLPFEGDNTKYFMTTKQFCMPCDAEFKIDDRGNIKFIEIGARGGGDHISYQLVQLSTGYDYVRGMIEVALDQFAEPKIKNKAYSGVYFLSKNTACIKNFIINNCSQSRHSNHTISNH
mgnify:CR=1 FL=1